MKGPPTHWTTLKKLCYLKAAGVIGGGAYWVWQLLTGAAPLTLLDAVAHPIHSLTQYGLCVQDGTPAPDNYAGILCNNGEIKARRQSGLPLGYQRVQWIKSAGAIVITGFKTKSTQEITTVFYRERSGSSYLYASDTATSGTTNTTAYLTSGGGNWRRDGKTATINVSTGVKVTSIQNKDGVWINGTKSGSYSAPGDFVSTNDLRLSSGENTTVRIESQTIREGETVTLDLVPVQRLSDSAYGFYDKVSGEFYTNAEATFEAGDPIDDPVEIYADGEDEVLTVSGANLLDPSPVTDDNKYIHSQNGSPTAPSATGGVFRYSGFIPIKAGTKYYFGMTPYSASAAGLAWYSDTTVASYISGVSGSTLRNVNSMMATAPAGARYLRFSWRIDEGYDTDWEHEVYVCACDSNSDPIMSAWQAYVTPQTVTGIPNLFATLDGTARDEIDLVSGLVTRRTEAVYEDGEIVIKPLAEPTTEQTTPHALHTSAGTNVVDVSAAVSPVQLSVEYAKEAS